VLIEYRPQPQSLTGLRPGARFFICSLLRRNTAEHFGQRMGSFLSNSAFTTKKAWWQRRQVNGSSRMLRIGRPPAAFVQPPARSVNVTSRPRARGFGASSWRAAPITQFDPLSRVLPDRPMDGALQMVFRRKA
jgi:hypothetical protein